MCVDLHFASFDDANAARDNATSLLHSTQTRAETLSGAISTRPERRRIDRVAQLTRLIGERGSSHTYSVSPLQRRYVLPRSTSSCSILQIVGDAGQAPVILPVGGVVEVDVLAGVDGLAAQAADADAVTVQGCNEAGSHLAVLGAVPALVCGWALR